MRGTPVSPPCVGGYDAGKAEGNVNTRPRSGRPTKERSRRKQKVIHTVMTQSTISSVALQLATQDERHEKDVMHSLPEDQGLTHAYAAVDALLSVVQQQNCSVILVTDSSISTLASLELWSSWGVAVFMVAESDHDSNVTQAQLCLVVDQARRLRQVSWCVTVVLVSDSAQFLASFTECSRQGRLLVWSTRLLAVTSLSLQQLHQLHDFFSMSNAMLLILQKTSENLWCSVYIYLPYCPKGSPALQLASWTPTRGLVLTSHLPLFPDKFFKFIKRPTLLVASEEFQSQRAIMVADPDSPGSQRLSFVGAISEIIEYMATQANFSITYVRPPDRIWGNKRKDGSWSGMMGMVITGAADVALGPFGTTSIRSEVVDFSWPVNIDYLRILGGRGHQEVDPWSFLLPLTPLVWAATLAALLILSVMHYLLSSWFNYHAMKRHMSSTDNLSYIRILLQQDLLVPAYWWWEKLMLVVWMMMAALVLTRSYSDSLISLLAVRNIPEPYESLRDVLDDSSVTMISQESSILSQHLQTVESGPFLEVKELEKVGRILYVPLGEFSRAADELVRPGHHVLIDITVNHRNLVAQDFSRTGRCDFYLSRETFLGFPFALIVKKNSPLAPMLFKRTLRIMETGLVQYWLMSTTRNSTDCLNSPKKITITSSLSLNNLWPLTLIRDLASVITHIVTSYNCSSTQCSFILFMHHVYYLGLRTTR
nr:glutamate receptor ionotropic, delta-1-like [Cherax quadricarinatus]